MRMFLVSAALALSICHATAQQSSFPLLADGGARNAYVSAFVRSCLKKQLGAPDNQNLSEAQITKFCNCHARAMADVLNGQEYESMGTGEIPNSFYVKYQRTGVMCTQRL